MYMAKKSEITVKDVSIRTMKVNDADYICITDIARQKNEIDPNGVIANWMRSRNTIEYLGLWETLHNTNFNPLEFEGFRKEAGLNVFTLSPMRWIDGVQQGERLVKLNQIAIQQMRVLNGDEERKLLK